MNAVCAVYGNRPKPFVMRVSAGDCVVLRFVNILPGNAMNDCLGDTRAAPIMPLNTDPAVEGAEDEAGVLRGRLRPEMTPATGIRPAATRSGSCLLASA